MDKLIIITALSFKCVEKKNDKFRLINFLNCCLNLLHQDQEVFHLYLVFLVQGA